MRNHADDHSSSPARQDRPVGDMARRRRREAARAVLAHEDDEWMPASQTLLPARMVGAFLESDYDLM